MTGKEMHVADMLSTVNLKGDDAQSTSELETVNMVTCLPLSNPRNVEIRSETENDEALQTLKKIILTGWPDTISRTPVIAQPYFNFRIMKSAESAVK